MYSKGWCWGSSSPGINNRLVYYSRNTDSFTDYVSIVVNDTEGILIRFFEDEDIGADYLDVYPINWFEHIIQPTEAELALFEIEFGIPFPADLFPEYVKLLEG